MCAWLSADERADVTSPRRALRLARCTFGTTRRPGRTTLHARFVLDDGELDAIRAALDQTPTVDRVYTIDLTDAEGTVHATVEKVIHIRRK